MRVRSVVVVTAAAVSLLAATAGCTSDKKSGPPFPANGSITSIPTGSGSLAPAGKYCTRLIAANSKIGTAQAALYSGNTAAVNTIVTELTTLQNGAPAEIKTSLANMITAFRAAADVVGNPTPENQAKLASLLQGLSVDSAKVSVYAANRCRPK